MRHSANSLSSHLDSALQSFPDGVLIFDTDGKVLFHNERLQQQLQLSQTKAKNFTIKNLIALTISVNDEQYDHDNFPYYQVLQNGNTTRNIRLVVKVTDKQRTFLVSVAPLITNAQQVTGVIFSFRDITLESKQTMLQKMFIKLLGHELKQPLGLIKAHTYYLSRILKKKPMNTTKYVKKIDDQVQVLTKMLNDIVDATKFSLNTFQIEKQPTDIVKLLHNAVADIRSAHPSRNMTLSIDEESPIMLDLDEIRITQAVQNLVSNAYKYSPANSPITITLKNTPTQVVIEVTDLGKGLTKSEIAKIFQPYYRSKKGEEQIGGLGLGLAFVKNVMTRHDGEVKVQSKIKKGSTFSLLFNKQ